MKLQRGLERKPAAQAGLGHGALLETLAEGWRHPNPRQPYPSALQSAAMQRQAMLTDHSGPTPKARVGTWFTGTIADFFRVRKTQPSGGA